MGVSLFDALGPAPPRDQDLDALKSWGINLVRVWAHWHEPIYLPDGALSEPGRTRLVQLAKRLESRGMIFELVLLRPGQLPGQPFALFASEAARLKAVESIASALREYRNVVFDLYNEHDHADGPISHRAARALRDKVKAIDPARLVTISSTEYHLVSAKGEMTDAGAQNLREEAGTGADAVGVDLVAAHLPRTDDWAAATGARVGAMRAVLEQSGPADSDLSERGASRGRWEAARRRQLRPCGDRGAQRGRRGVGLSHDSRVRADEDGFPRRDVGRRTRRLSTAKAALSRKFSSLKFQVSRVERLQPSNFRLQTSDFEVLRSASSAAWCRRGGTSWCRTRNRR